MKNFLILLLIGVTGILFINSNFRSEDEKEASIERGENIYIFNCINCHMADGQGEVDMYPPLAGSDFLLENIDESIKMTMVGSQGGTVVNGKSYNMEMEAIYITNEELADVMNYILNTWGNSSNEVITPERIQKLR